MFERQTDINYILFERQRLAAISTIDKPLFQTKDASTWMRIFLEISSRVQYGEMENTLQGSIFLLAQRWGKAIDLRSDMFPEMDYEQVGFCSSDAFEVAFSNTQGTKALALVVSTHVYGEEIAKQIIERYKYDYRKGDIFDYATQRPEKLVFELDDLSHSNIKPHYLANTPRKNYFWGLN